MKSIQKHFSRHIYKSGKLPGKNAFFPGIGARLVISLWLLFAVTMVASYLGVRNGVPLLSFRGYAAETREAVFHSLSVTADFKKAVLENLISQQRAAAALITDNPSFRSDVSALRRSIQVAHRTGRGGELLPYLKETDTYGRVKGTLQVFEGSYGIYDRIEILNPGVFSVMASTDESRLSQVVPYFEKYYRRLPRHGESLIFTTGGQGSMESHLHVARRVYGPDTGSGAERVVGILVMHIIKELYLQEYLHSGEQLGLTGEAFIVDEKGQTLTPLKFPLSDGSSPEKEGYLIRENTALLAARGNEGMVEEKDYRGKPVLAAFRHLEVNPESGWGLVVKRDIAEVFAPMRRAERFFFMTMFLGFILSLPISYFTIMGIIRPLEKLGDTARDVARGHFEARASEEEGTIEVRTLARGLNVMLEHVQAWYDEMEKEVAHRTAELRREIVERQHVEVALKRSEAHSRSILEAAFEAIITTDDKGTVTGWNTAAEDMFGYTASEMIDASVAQIIPEEYRKDHQAVMERLKEGHPPSRIGQPVELNGLKKDGTVFPLELSMARVEDDGRNEYTAVITNISRRRHSEQQMLEARKLEGLGSLAGGIAHHFNNLLMGISGNVAIASMKLPDGDPVRKHLENIEATVKRAAAIIAQLQAYSGRGGTGVSDVERVDMNDTVRELSDLFAVSLPRTASVVLNLSGEPVPVKADRAQMRHVVMSLITNAGASLGEKEGTITVTTGVRWCDSECLLASSALSEFKEGYYSFLEVSDTGDGLDQATVERIFDPFFSTWKESGGLGMALVLGITKTFGGMVSVDSKPGEGTAFRVEFPLAGEAGPSKSRDLSEPGR